MTRSIVSDKNRLTSPHFRRYNRFDKCKGR